MDQRVPLESDALKLCRQALRKPTSTAVGGLPAAQRGRVKWMLPELAKLIAQQHDRPACDFALTARQFIDEHTFVEDAGDPLFDERVNDEAQALIEVSLRVHRAVHHRAGARPAWRDASPPPLMCG